MNPLCGFQHLGGARADAREFLAKIALYLLDAARIHAFYREKALSDFGINPVQIGQVARSSRIA